MQEMFRGAQRPFFGLGFVALAIACLTLARDYAVPFAIAVLIWFLINALSAQVRRLPGVGPWLPGWVARLVSVLLLFGVLFFSGRVVFANIGELGAGVPADQEVALAKIEALLARVGIDVKVERQQVWDMLGFEALIGWALRTARGLITDASFVLLYVLFLMVDEKFYEPKLRALVTEPDRREDLRATLRLIATETRLYLWLMTLISLGVALVTYAVCAAVGLSGAGFWGFVAFALNFIPTIGSILAVVLPAVYGLLTLNDPVLVVVLACALSATQFTAGELVLPRLMGDRLNLSATVILLALVSWGAMWGPAGMFLAIPITVILVIICARFEATRPIAVVLSRDGQVLRG